MRDRLYTGIKKAADSLRSSPIAGQPVIKGKAGNVIVVKTPNPMFSQAIFVLRDDFFSSRELSRTELLKQAKTAAKDYTASVTPRYSGPLPMLFSALFGSALTLFFSVLI